MSTIFLVVAIVLFIFAGLKIETERISTMAIGLAFLAASFLF